MTYDGTKTAAQLREELAAAERAEAQVGADAAKALPLIYEWKVEQKSAHVYYVVRRVAQVSVDAYNEWRAKYPRSTASPGWTHWSLHNGEAKWEGMLYVLIGNYLVMTGGGTLVLKMGTPKDPFNYEPRLLTDEEAAALRALTVPNSLKAS